MLNGSHSPTLLDRPGRCFRLAAKPRADAVETP
jgi:hypothetical protein